MASRQIHNVRAQEYQTNSDLNIDVENPDIMLEGMKMHFSLGLKSEFNT